MKEEKLDWVMEKNEFEPYIRIFSPYEWQVIENVGFRDYCTHKLYSPKTGVNYLENLKEMKKAMVYFNENGVTFSMLAEHTFEHVLSNQTKEVSVSKKPKNKSSHTGKRKMPKWTVVDPEFYKVAKKFNGMQLKVLKELGFDRIPKEYYGEIIPALNAIVLEKKKKEKYKTNRDSFASLVLHMMQKKFKSFTQFIELLQSEPVSFKTPRHENMVKKKPNKAQTMFFEECRKETPSLEIMQELFLQDIQVAMQDQYEKTGLDYICEQDKPCLELILMILNTEYLLYQKTELPRLSLHMNKLILQAMKENKPLFILMMITLATDDMSFLNAIKEFSNKNGSLLEQVLYLYLLADRNNKKLFSEYISDGVVRKKNPSDIMQILLNKFSFLLKGEHSHAPHIIVSRKQEPREIIVNAPPRKEIKIPKKSSSRNEFIETQQIEIKKSASVASVSHFKQSSKKHKPQKRETGMCMIL